MPELVTIGLMLWFIAYLGYTKGRDAERRINKMRYRFISKWNLKLFLVYDDDFDFEQLDRFFQQSTLFKEYHGFICN